MEIWKAYPDYPERFMVSSLGKVKSATTGKILVQGVNKRAIQS